MFIRPSKTDADFHRPRPPQSRRRSDIVSAWIEPNRDTRVTNTATFDLGPGTARSRPKSGRFRGCILSSMGLAERDLQTVPVDHRERIERIVERESAERAKAEERRQKSPNSRPTPDEMDKHFTNAFDGLAELDQFLAIFDPVEPKSH